MDPRTISACFLRAVAEKPPFTGPRAVPGSQRLRQPAGTRGNPNAENRGPN